MQSANSGMTSFVVVIVSILGPPTVLLLILRRYVPVLGEAAWRRYCEFLILLAKAPFRLIQLMINEIVKRHRR